MRAIADLPFSRAEYAERLTKVRKAMDRVAVDVLIVTDPSNMAWLSGYDGWSFYVHQCLIVTFDELPIWFGREQDANGAKRTVYMDDSHIEWYADEYVQSPHRHPMDVLSAVLHERGWGLGRVGVEMDNYYFTAACLRSLTTHLPKADFFDATAMVNWERAIKSARELEYMVTAGRIVSRIHEAIFERISPGMPKHELVADIYHAGIAGLDDVGGDYPAIVPLLPSGPDAGAPHLTWDERPIERNMGTFFEVAGCYRRYHCPQSRTVYLGHPPAHFRRAEQASIEAIERILQVARVGVRCADVALALDEVLARFEMKKTSRCGYAIGLSYPPDWGERTMSFRADDQTVLEENMTFHFIPALWFDDWGVEITESIRITNAGAEPLAETPRKLMVKA